MKPNFHNLIAELTIAQSIRRADPSLGWPLKQEDGKVLDFQIIGERDPYRVIGYAEVKDSSLQWGRRDLPFFLIPLIKVTEADTLRQFGKPTLLWARFIDGEIMETPLDDSSIERSHIRMFGNPKIEGDEQPHIGIRWAAFRRVL